MSDLDQHEVVAARRTSDGRIVRFATGGVQPSWLLPWCGVVCDTGDQQIVPVRLDQSAAPEGWTARQLMQIVRRRLLEEAERCPLPVTCAAVAALELASVVRLERGSGWITTGQDVAFMPGAAASPYTWTIAQQSGLSLALCSDPECRGEGVTPEQLLIVLDQVLQDTAAAIQLPGLRQVHEHLTVALAAEVKRLAILRG